MYWSTMSLLSIHGFYHIEKTRNSLIVIENNVLRIVFYDTYD